MKKIKGFLILGTVCSVNFKFQNITVMFAGFVNFDLFLTDITLVIVFFVSIEK